MAQLDTFLALTDDMSSAEDLLDGTTDVLPFTPPPLDDARKILRWLRNLDAVDCGIDEWLARSGVETQAAKLDHLNRLCRIYIAQLKQSEQASLREDASVLGGCDAVSAMTLAAVEHVLDMLPDRHPMIDALEDRADALTGRGSKRRGQSIRRLLEMMEFGLERMSGKFIGERTPVDRLVELSNRIVATALKLRSIDTLQEPAREESIELAREILKHRNIAGSELSMEAMMGSGRPGDKAAFAQQIDDMAQMYKNLLAEASKINPALLLDKRVQDANDAVGSFAYGISLMAAKEMPGSVAATQQISAEAAQMPEQWKNLNGRVADRLRTVNAGLEQAVNAIEQQQEAQQKRAEESQQENAQQQQQSNAQSTGKRRSGRRRSSGSGGLTKTAARRNAGDLNGDGIADNLQGLNIRGDNQIKVRAGSTDRSTSRPSGAKAAVPVKVEVKSPGGAPKLRPEDLAAVQKLGGALRDLGQQAKVLLPADTKTVVNNPASITDDRTFVAKSTERDQQQQTRPGQNKPTMGA